MPQLAAEKIQHFVKLRRFCMYQTDALSEARVEESQTGSGRSLVFVGGFLPW